MTKIRCSILNSGSKVATSRFPEGRAGAMPTLRSQTRVARLTMRTLSFAFLVASLPAIGAFAETAQLAPIPRPLPFPEGSSIFQWDYQCIERKVCGFTGLGLERLSLQSASVVLAKIKVGEIELPTYFIWCTLVDGSLVAAMAQSDFQFRFSTVNMKLTGAG